MDRPSSHYVALSLLCVAALTTACSGAEPQDVLLGPSGSSSSSDASGTTSACPSEQEPNDDEDAANVLAPLLCGTLSGRGDRDHLTFRLKPDTRSMTIRFTGRVRLRVDVAGHDTTELTPDNSSHQLPFVLGEDYIIEIRSLTKSDADATWRVEIVETSS